MASTHTVALLQRYAPEPEDVDIAFADVPRPALSGDKKQLLVRVLACSLAAGDVHMISGRMTFVMRPPPNGEPPFVPGMDLVGRVEAVAPGVEGFKVGDVVVANNEAMPVGGMAEYAVVWVSNAALKPAGIPDLVAAACPTSAVTADEFVHRVACVRRGERVLVLGGAGGVGSAVVQYAKLAGASFVATTTTQTALLTRLGADAAIDYRTGPGWWETPAFLEAPFDVIIDCVGGPGGHWAKACGGVLKSRWAGGRFVPVVTDDSVPVVRTLGQLLGFAAGMLWRPTWNLLCPWLPRYVFTGPSFSNAPKIAAVLAAVADGKLQIPLDEPRGFPFTPAGVTAALRRQASGHAHGKVVVDMGRTSDEQQQVPPTASATTATAAAGS